MNTVRYFKGSLLFAEKLTAYMADTTQGVVYDSLINIMYHAAFSYQLGPNDASGLVKPSEPLQPTQAILNGNYPVIETIYPNPFGSSTSINFTLPGDDGNVRLSLNDALGHTAATIAVGSFRAGHHTVTFENDALS